MQIDAQKVIPLLEGAGKVAFFDSETTGLRGDYNSFLVATVKPWHEDPVTFTVGQRGHDRKLVQQLRDELQKYEVIVGYYSKGFDVPMLNTRALYHRVAPLGEIYHVDMFYQLKPKLLLASKSQAHLLNFLKTPQQKMTVAPAVWNMENDTADLKTLQERCESDCAGLENLWDATKHLIKDITK